MKYKKGDDIYLKGQNQYMAVYTFIDEVSTKVRSTMSKIFVSEVEEVEL